MTLAAWGELRDERPALAKRIKDLGAAIYEQGSENAQTSKETSELEDVLRPLPKEILEALGLKPGFSREELLIAVFRLGGKMLVHLERGGTT